jgi:ADP-ribosyl-[dinitrogen reductase] hydrolase
MKSISLEARYLGAMLGLACGDAVGTTLEFASRDSYEPVEDMTGGGPFELAPGQWTDDTAMALCLAQSLVYRQGFDAVDQMNRYCNWWQYGYMSSTGECFDIGATVQGALNRYLKTLNPFAGDIDPMSSGNGSLMRLAPVPLYYFPNTEAAIRYAGESSRTTHASEECIDACRYFAALFCAILSGVNKDNLLQECLLIPATRKLKELSAGNFVSKPRADIRGTGYVMESIEAALWCFFNTASYKEAVLCAANLGEDADTTAAICGQLAGAYYGTNNIPQNWLDKLMMIEEISELARKLI